MILKEHPPMPYNYAWAVADPEAGLDFGQVPFTTMHSWTDWFIALVDSDHIIPIECSVWVCISYLFLSRGHKRCAQFGHWPSCLLPSPLLLHFLAGWKFLYKKMKLSEYWASNAVFAEDIRFKSQSVAEWAQQWKGGERESWIVAFSYHIIHRGITNYNLEGIQILILKLCQNENSDGNVVSGEYRVLLPDGRTQIVR